MTFAPDDDIAIVLSAIVDRDDLVDILEARKRTHDQLIEMLGTSRQSGVTWLQFDAPEGLRVLAEFGPEYDGVRAFLRGNPHGALIAATAKGDRPRHEGRRRTG